VPLAVSLVLLRFLVGEAVLLFQLVLAQRGAPPDSIWTFVRKFADLKRLSSLTVSFPHKSLSGGTLADTCAVKWQDLPVLLFAV
jgi:hypothetical protein